MAHDDPFRLEEYRHLSSAIIDLDHRIVQVFGLMIAAAGALLGIAATAVFTDDDQGRAFLPALWALVPAYVVVGVLRFQLALRRDIARLGMYRRVFFEEDGCAGLRWETALARFRPALTGETNDPITLAYWSIAGASTLLFAAGLHRAGGSWWHLLWAAIPVGLLLTLDVQWRNVFKADVQAMYTEWRRVKAELPTGQPSPAESN